MYLSATIRELGIMQSSAILINTATGGLVGKTALEEALVGGRLACASLDVFKNEPAHPTTMGRLGQMTNVICLQHV